MMADTGIGRILPTEVISPIQSYDRGTGSLHEDVGALRRERTLRVGQGVRKKGLGKQESAEPEMIVVVEQWICLVLRLVCWGETQAAWSRSVRPWASTELLAVRGKDPSESARTRPR
jgi:hypothetical protein